jgi:Uma2 family endonuclease
VVTSDQRVKTPSTGLYTYPDVVIACGELQFEDSELDTLLNPQVIVEVLSDSTEGYDRGSKFHHYQGIASLREYILVSQNEPLVERFVRQDDGDWLLTHFAGLDAIFEYVSVVARIPLAEIYRGVPFSENPGE